MSKELILEQYAELCDRYNSIVFETDKEFLANKAEIESKFASTLRVIDNVYKFRQGIIVADDKCRTKFIEDSPKYQ